MNRSRIGIALTAVAVALLAVVAVIKIVHSGGEEAEAGAPDMAVHVGKIGRSTLHQFVSAYGSVQPEPAGPDRPAAGSEVASPVAGVLAHTDCAEGQKVARGDVLFRLDSRLAEVAQDRAKKNLAYADRTFERQKKLLAAEGTSQKSYLEAELQLNTARSDLAEAETCLALLRIQAPLSGTVVKINRKPGEAVELNSVLATIVDLDRLVVAVNVPRREVSQVKVGQPTEIEAAGAASSRVVFVGSSVDEKTDTVPVRITIPQGSGYLPGRFLSVRIVTAEHAGCLAVPVAALVADTLAGDTGEIVLLDGDKAVRKPVKIGFREGDLAEVEAPGLSEGQAIVTTDAYAVTDGMQVRIITDAHE